MKRAFIILAGLALVTASGCATGSNNKVPWVMPLSINLWKSSSTTIIEGDGSTFNPAKLTTQQSVDGSDSATIPVTGKPLLLKLEQP